jgi:hypothetical protein
MDIRRSAAEFLAATANAPAPAPAPVEQPATEPAAPTEAGTTPATEEAPPAVEPSTEETSAEPATEGEATVAQETETPTEEGETPIPDAKTLRISPREDDQVGRLAAAFQRRNRDWTLKECMAAAEKQLGIAPEQATPAAPKDTPGKPQLPQTVEAVDNTVNTLMEERTKAFSELRFEDVAKIDVQVRSLDLHRTKLERDAEKQQIQQAQAYDRGFVASENQAKALYDFASNPESPGGKRMQEIEAAMEQTGDPLYFSPEKPLRIAQMVALELNIAPRRKGAPPAPAKAAATTQAPQAKKQVLPGGSTVPPVAKPNPIEAKITSARSPQDIRKVMAEMGIPQM